MDDRLDHAPCGFASINDDGIIVDANSTLAEMLGCSKPGELTGRRFDSVLTVASRIFYQTHLFPLLSLHGKGEEVFMTLRSVAGSDLPVIVNAVRHSRSGTWMNDCVFFLLQHRQKYEAEILAAKRTAEEALRSNEQLIQAKRDLERHTRELDRQIARLEQKNRELHRLSQILFHDMREPLRKLLSFADLLQTETERPMGATAQLCIERMDAAARRIDSLLRAIQEYLVVDSGTDPIEAVNLSDAVARAAKRATNEASCTLTYTAADLPTIEGYGQQIELLFFHLFDNAVKFRDPHKSPHVAIDAATLKQNRFAVLKQHYEYVDFIRIIFSDNSAGFESETPEALFQLLSKGMSDATGLSAGLAICRKIVENHYGSISLKSHPGRGAEYTILLPLRQSHDSQSEAEVAAPATP